MKIAISRDLKSKTFRISKSYTPFIEKEISIVNFKFYQKLFIILISFSTILIFPESPSELGNICEDYNSKQVCNIW
tara:strand:- start:130 stop:357 length:228 start_codon:yes stop_codon:yes gene_type:complete